MKIYKFANGHTLEDSIISLFGKGAVNVLDSMQVPELDKSSTALETILTAVDLLVSTSCEGFEASDFTPLFWDMMHAKTVGSYISVPIDISTYAEVSNDDSDCAYASDSTDDSGSTDASEVEVLSVISLDRASLLEDDTLDIKYCGDRIVYTESPKEKTIWIKCKCLEYDLDSSNSRYPTLAQIFPEPVYRGEIYGPIGTYSGTVTIGGNCTITSIDGPAIEATGDLTIRGTGTLTLVGTGPNPAIGTVTHLATAGRWKMRDYCKLNSITIDGVCVICTSDMSCFTLGSLGHANVPEIRCINGGRLECPETTGERILVGNWEPGWYLDYPEYKIMTNDKRSTDIMKNLTVQMTAFDNC